MGQDTDGTVTPDDAGLSWAIGKSKEDFVGKRSLMRPAMNAPDRKQLVGLATVDPQVVLEEGAQIASAAGLKPALQAGRAHHLLVSQPRPETLHCTGDGQWRAGSDGTDSLRVDARR